MFMAETSVVFLTIQVSCSLPAFWAVTLVKTCFCVHVALPQISVYGWDVSQFHGLLSQIMSHIVRAAIVADFARRFVWMVRCRLQRKCHYSWDVSIFLQWYQPQTLFDKVAKCMFSGSAKRPSSKNKTNPPGTAGPWTQGFMEPA